MKKKIAFLGVSAVLAISLTGCGKYTEPFKDAPRDGVNDSPAQTVTMPDGFNNLATKCDHGNRVYTLYHNDAAYGGVAVVPHDPTCAGR